jgi:hypothetical protein
LSNLAPVDASLLHMVMVCVLECVLIYFVCISIRY